MFAFLEMSRFAAIIEIYNFHGETLNDAMKSGFVRNICRRKFNLDFER